MEIIKYILSCICGCFDALTGKGMSGGIKEGAIGLVAIATIILLFFISFIVLDRKTNLNYKFKLLSSIATTLLVIIFIVFLFILIGKIF